MDAQGIIRGSLGEVSNRSDWIADIELLDESTGDPYDISSATFEVQIHDINNNQLILATTANGKVTLPAATTGIFRITILLEEISTISAGTYDIGIRMTLGGIRYQLFIATISIIEGHVT